MANDKRAAQMANKNKPPRFIERNNFYGFVLDDEQLLFVNSIWDKDKLVIMCNAAAGSGKTQLATGVANLLVQYGFFEKIVYIVSSYGENRQGYLPGSITEKSEVYFEPFYQALLNCDVNPNTAINTASMINQKNGTAYITCLTHTFLRGTNLDNAVVIIDEAQNFTVPELKKTLTRCSDNCKVICIGHDLQCDLPDHHKSGFVQYINHFNGDPRTAVCNLTKNYRGWISSHADSFGSDGIDMLHNIKDPAPCKITQWW